MRRFYPELESLRGVAALVVVAMHANLTFGLPADSLRQSIVVALLPGQSAVVLFFVLSGFVLSQSLPRTLPEAILHYPGYAVRRACRILPAMWLAIGFSLAAASVFGQAPDWSAAVDAARFISSNIDPPLWSLKPELYLGLFVLPILAFLAPRIGVLGNAAVLLLLVWHDWHNELPFAYQFHLGCLVPTWGAWIVARLRGWPGGMVYGGAILAFCVATPLNSHLGPLWWPQMMALMALPAFLIVAYVHSGNGPMVQLLRTRPLRFCGRISYSVYVLHWPMLGLLAPLYFRYFGSQALYTAAALLGIIPLAALAYYAVERPGVFMGRRFFGAVRLQALMFCAGPAAAPAWHEPAVSNSPSRRAVPAAEAPAAEL